jgi:hypothetical protein
MRCFLRIWDILSRRIGGGAQDRAVVLEHRPTGGFLSVGAGLASDVSEALVFPTEAEATELLTRFGCEPGDFTAVELQEPALSYVA